MPYLGIAGKTPQMSSSWVEKKVVIGLRRRVKDGPWSVSEPEVGGGFGARLESRVVVGSQDGARTGPAWEGK